MTPQLTSPGGNTVLRAPLQADLRADCYSNVTFLHMLAPRVPVLTGGWVALFISRWVHHQEVALLTRLACLQM
jgi:hypothetical protein